MQQVLGYSSVIVTALRGGAGKTLLSIGITAALRTRGKSVAPFKKGPDYIDAGWLALAAGRPCYNLDTFLIEEDRVLQSFRSRIKPGDIALIEGNRGLFDGLDSEGSISTAALAKLISSPLILCIDCTKATRTVAAMVLGCLEFDRDIRIKGVVLNRVAGLRHETVVRTSIETHCGVPVLGAIPKLDQQHLPERHMGLVPSPEHSWAEDAIKTIAGIIETHLDLDAILALAEDAGQHSDTEVSPSPVIPLPGDESPPARGRNTAHRPSGEGELPRIGIIRDAAFSFYYPENIEALVSAGAEPVFISPLKTDVLPPVDALYIGGGFPETHAAELGENTLFREKLRSLAEAGLPIYAECGGFMFLGEALVLDGVSYPMVGVLPVVFTVSERPQGHGYTVVRVEGENPYFDVGTEIRGHEFHYSRVLRWCGTDKDLVFGMKRGTGFKGKRDGLCYKRVLATFTHIHALGTPGWAKAMVRNAQSWKAEKGSL